MLSTSEMSTGETELVGRALNSQRLFSWGANSYGQLGSGHSNDTPVPREVLVPKDCSHNILSISGGGGHTLALLKNGILMVCGSNEKGQLGIGSTENVSVLTPVIDMEGEIISKAVGGWDFTLIMNEKGQIFVTGSNHFNQLGLTDLKEKFITRPIKLCFPSNPKIVDIAAGLRHGVALTDKGQIYQWGRRKASKPKDGGMAQIDSSPRSVKIPPLLKGRVILIRAGSYFFAGLTDYGEVICWGENNYGQLSLSPEISKELVEPHIVNMQHFDGIVTDVQTGWTHVLALTDKQMVYSWGRANYGQLGRKVDLQFDPTPQPIIELDDVTCISCGSEHNLALSGVNYRMITWGWNEHGLCGNGNEDNVLVPHQVETLSDHVIKLIGCGAGHSFALTEKT